MLNKNQSKKRNSWKYYTVIPALAAFVFLFQIEVVAHEKPTTENRKTNVANIDVFKITKNTTDEELKEKTKTFKDKYDITATFSNMERNSKNELIAIKVELKKGKEISQQMQIKSSEVITAFGIIISTLEDGKLNVDFKSDETSITNENVKALNAQASTKEREIYINGEKATEEELKKLDPNEIESMDVSKNGEKGTIKIITKHPTKPIKISDKEVYINGVKSNQKELLDLDQSTIDKMDVNTNENTIRITTKTITNVNDNTNVKVNTKVTTIVNQDEQPLIIIDGKRAEPNVTVNTIPSNTIASIDVLKGKSAETAYGSDGKNGVLLITTKSAANAKGKTTNTIEIRTKNKKIGSGNQLIIIDGKKSSITDADELNQLNIEKMQVWNGVEAVAKYGDEGKNGVIEITTKK